MERCWNCSATALEGPPRTFHSQQDGAPALSPQFPHRAFWGALSAILLMVVIALSVVGHIGFRQPDPQVVRIIVPDETGMVVNQSALVDQRNDVVIYSVTSIANHTSTVMFDIKHGLICYKPDNQEICFLRKMEGTDYENVHTLLDESKKVNQFWLVGNETQRHTEFLGVLGGSQVDASTLQEPLQTLCQQSSIYWTRRADGPGKQRLIYFCIDICFPSNICVSVCFYYLPE
ncbi:BRICHOS domain-containing protein 5 isoform X2 [Anguilla rostrata]|uniref:BRICHOS domain-containing protein 5 isoform X2 n=1 Tax=Anguilla rostrata TaxID=7938 RepID=UPI0030D1E136